MSGICCLSTVCLPACFFFCSSVCLPEYIFLTLPLSGKVNLVTQSALFFISTAMKPGVTVTGVALATSHSASHAGILTAGYAGIQTGLQTATGTANVTANVTANGTVNITVDETANGTVNLTANGTASSAVFDDKSFYSVAGTAATAATNATNATSGQVNSIIPICAPYNHAAVSSLLLQVG